MKILDSICFSAKRRPLEPPELTDVEVLKATEDMHRHFGGDFWLEECRSGRVQQWASGKSFGIQLLLQSNNPGEVRDVLDFYFRENPERRKPVLSG